MDRHIEVFKKEQQTKPNQNDGANWALLAPGPQGIRGNFAAIYGLRRLHCFKRSVKNKPSQQDANYRLDTLTKTGCESQNHGGKNRDINQALVVLAVVDGTESRKDERQDEGYGRVVAPWRTRRGNGRHIGACVGRCWRSRWRLQRHRRRRWCRSGMAHDRSEAIFAIKYVANRPRAGRAHRLSAISTKPRCVHIGMDGTFHRVELPSINTTFRSWQG